MMLIHADQERALNYLSSCIEQVQNFGEFQIFVLVKHILGILNFSEHFEFLTLLFTFQVIF